MKPFVPKQAITPDMLLGLVFRILNEMIDEELESSRVTWNPMSWLYSGHHLAKWVVLLELSKRIEFEVVKLASDEIIVK